jgi:putative oxidoreductase
MCKIKKIKGEVKMYSLNKIESWADHHHPKWIDFLRILLGLILVIKGIAFIANKDEVILMVRYSVFEFLSFVIAHYVITAYLVGGLAVMLGFLTRFAILFQIPAVLGAIIFIDIHSELFALNSDLVYSILILFLLFFFLFYGSGNYSVDSYLRKVKEE